VQRFNAAFKEASHAAGGLADTLLVFHHGDANKALAMLAEGDPGRDHLTSPVLLAHNGGKRMRLMLLVFYSDGHIPTPEPTTLLLWGKQDPVVPLSVGELYKKQIAGAQLVTFDKCGHMPEIEKSAEFIKEVESFLG